MREWASASARLLAFNVKSVDWLNFHNLWILALDWFARCAAIEGCGSSNFASYIHHDVDANDKEEEVAGDCTLFQISRTTIARTLLLQCAKGEQPFLVPLRARKTAPFLRVANTLSLPCFALPSVSFCFLLRHLPIHTLHVLLHYARLRVWDLIEMRRRGTRTTNARRQQHLFKNSNLVCEFKFKIRFNGERTLVCSLPRHTTPNNPIPVILKMGLDGDGRKAGEKTRSAHFCRAFDGIVISAECTTIFHRLASPSNGFSHFQRVSDRHKMCTRIRCTSNAHSHVLFHFCIWTRSNDAGSDVQNMVSAQSTSTPREWKTKTKLQ